MGLDRDGEMIADILVLAHLSHYKQELNDIVGRVPLMVNTFHISFSPFSRHDPAIYVSCFTAHLLFVSRLQLLKQVTGRFNPTPFPYLCEYSFPVFYELNWTAAVRYGVYEARELKCNCFPFSYPCYCSMLPLNEAYFEVACNSAKASGLLS